MRTPHNPKGKDPDVKPASIAWPFLRGTELRARFSPKPSSIMNKLGALLFTNYGKFDIDPETTLAEVYRLKQSIKLEAIDSELGLGRLTLMTAETFAHEYNNDWKSVENETPILIKIDDYTYRIHGKVNNVWKTHTFLLPRSSGHLQEAFQRVSSDDPKTARRKQRQIDYPLVDLFKRLPFDNNELVTLPPHHPFLLNKKFVQTLKPFHTEMDANFNHFAPKIYPELYAREGEYRSKMIALAFQFIFNPDDHTHDPDIDELNPIAVNGYENLFPNEHSYTQQEAKKLRRIIDLHFNLEQDIKKKFKLTGSFDDLSALTIDKYIHEYNRYIKRRNPQRKREITIVGKTPLSTLKFKNWLIKQDFFIRLADVAESENLPTLRALIHEIYNAKSSNWINAMPTNDDIQKLPISSKKKSQLQDDLNKMEQECNKIQSLPKMEVKKVEVEENDLDLLERKNKLIYESLLYRENVYGEFLNRVENTFKTFIDESKTHDVPTPIKDLLSTINNFRNDPEQPIRDTMQKITRLALLASGSASEINNPYRPIANFIDFKQTLINIKESIYNTSFKVRLGVPTTLVEWDGKTKGKELPEGIRRIYEDLNNEDRTKEERVINFLKICHAKTEEFSLTGLFFRHPSTTDYYKQSHQLIALKKGEIHSLNDPIFESLRSNILPRK